MRGQVMHGGARQPAEARDVAIGAAQFPHALVDEPLQRVLRHIAHLFPRPHLHPSARRRLLDGQDPLARTARHLRDLAGMVTSKKIGHSSDQAGHRAGDPPAKEDPDMTASTQGLTAQGLAGSGILPQQGTFTPGFPPAFGVEQYLGTAQQYGLPTPGWPQGPYGMQAPYGQVPWSPAQAQFGSQAPP